MVKSPIVQFIIVLLMSLWWFGWSGTLFLSSTRVIFAASIDRMLPEWVSRIEPRTKTPINALLLMVIPSAIISYLYAFKIFSMQHAGAGCDGGDCHHLPGLHDCRHGHALAGQGCLRRLADRQVQGAFLAGLDRHGAFCGRFAVYLIYISFTYAWTILGGIGALSPDATDLVRGDPAGAADHRQCGDPVVDPVLRGPQGDQRRRHAADHAGRPDLPGLPRLAAGRVVLGSARAAGGAAAVGTYAIGWSNVSSMVFMLLNYVVAAAIYFGFSAYRRRQGIDVDKIYKEIPVE